MSKVTGVLAILLWLSSGAAAQISKGSYLIGGNGNYKRTRMYFSSAESFRLSNFSFTSNIGRFFFNQIAGGIAINYERYERKTNAVPPQESLYRNKYWTFGPFARIYFLKSGSKLNFLADGKIGWQYSRALYEFGRTPATYMGTSYQALGGPAFFLDQHVAVELLGGYTGFLTKMDQGVNTRAFEVRLGLQVHLTKKEKKKS